MIYDKEGHSLVRTPHFATRNALALAIAAVAVGLAGCSVTSAASTSDSVVPETDATAVPSNVAETPKKDVEKITAYVFPDNGTYGVAAPIAVHFSDPIPKKSRLATENLITMTASNPLSPGAWVWTSDDVVTFRTKDFLPARTTINVDVNLKNVVFSETPKKVIKGGKDASGIIKTGRDMETIINGKTKKAVVSIDDKKVRTMNVSLGKAGWLTRSGIKTTGEKYRVQRMTSAEIGAGEFYDLQVPYAVRLTDSGEFIHAAPWATGRLGRSNGSHGCTNLGMGDGQWFYTKTLMFDPVITVGTKRSMETWNGAGAIWNYSWEQWAAKSLSAPISVVPTQPTSG